MYDRTISLPEKTETTRDSEGYRKDIVTWASGIPASRRDVTRNDEIVAQQSGYTADAIYRIASVCYNGEAYLRDDADYHIYDIKRSYHADKRMYVDLTCQRREQDG